jgi:hypothetical protein
VGTDAVLSVFTPEVLRETAEKYLSTENYVRAYLKPEGQGAERK